MDNDNQDDGAGPDKEMREVGKGGGVRTLNSVMVMVIVGGGQGGIDMTTVWRTMRTRTRFWGDNGWGQEEEEEEDQQHPFQQDHVDFTNSLYLLNRSVTPPVPPES